MYDHQLQHQMQQMQSSAFLNMLAAQQEQSLYGFGPQRNDFVSQLNAAANSPTAFLDDGLQNSYSAAVRHENAKPEVPHSWARWLWQMLLIGLFD
jgi:hypothetical protein